MTVEFPIDGPLLTAGVLLMVGVLVVGVSDRLRVPTSLLSLGIGMIVGSDVLGLVDVDNAALVRDISIVAVIVILFEGGLTTKPSALREAGLPGFLLSNLGVLTTAAITALGIHYVVGMSWETSLILGAVVSSTDAAVVFDLLRRAPLPRRLGSVLEVESGANDPFAILLTVGLVEFFTGGVVTPTEVVLFGAIQLFGGLLAGGVVGWLGSLLLRLPLRSQALYPLLATGVAAMAYGAATWISGSGFLAVYIAGLLVGALVPRERRVIRSFYSSLAVGTDLVLFLILGLLVFPARLPSIAIPGLIVAAILIFIARPIAVLVSLLPFRFDRRELTLLSWAGLRGAVPIILATIPATAGVPAGGAIFNVVFFVVVVSTLLQGTTVAPLARRLGLAVDRPPWQSIAEALPLEGVEVDLVEVNVTDDLAIVGQRLSDVPPGPAMLVTTVVRGTRAILPRADTVFEAGDLVVLAIDRERGSVGDVTAWARGENRAAEVQPLQPELVFDEDQPA